jgi:predicted  nucleic acid-binding Zn-ribbon protein
MSSRMPQQPNQPAHPSQSTIMELWTKDYKKTVLVCIRPKEIGIVPITGKNEQGKSSTIDALLVALRGQRYAPEVPIRTGADKATVKVKLSDGYVINRIFTGKSEYLTITDENGNEVRAPQTWLNERIGQCSFDPSEFIKLGEKDHRKQIEELLKTVDFKIDTNGLQEACNVAFSKEQLAGVHPLDILDSVYTHLFEKRKEASGEVKRLKAVKETLLREIPPAKLDVKPVSISEIMKDKAILEAMKKTNDDRRGRLNGMETELTSKVKQIEALAGEMADLERRLLDARTRMDSLTNEHKSLITNYQDELTAVSGLVDPDFTEINQRIQDADSTNEIAQKVRQYQEAVTNHSAAEQRETVADGRITAFTEFKQRTMAAANFPVPGLDIVDGKLHLNGLPFSQASTAEQLKVSLAISMKQNDSIRVIRIKDGNCFDKDSWAIMEQMAEAEGYQIWVERVADEPGMGFFICAGEVVDVDGQGPPVIEIPEEVTAQVFGGKRKKAGKIAVTDASVTASVSAAVKVGEGVPIGNGERIVHAEVAVDPKVSPFPFLNMTVVKENPDCKVTVGIENPDSDNPSVDDIAAMKAMVGDNRDDDLPDF